MLCVDEYAAVPQTPHKKGGGATRCVFAWIDRNETKRNETPEQQEAEPAANCMRNVHKHRRLCGPTKHDLRAEKTPLD